MTAAPKDKQWNVIRFLTLGNVLGSEIHMNMRVVYGAEYYHKSNRELIDTKIEGDMNEYEQLTSRWWTIKKKDPVYCRH